MSNLLPINATAQERAIDDAIARIGEVPIPLRDVWNPETCPNQLLPWLAWAFGVDEWDAEWSDAAKRQTINEAVKIQRTKGSVASIKRAIAAAGYGDSQLIEGDTSLAYDAEHTHNGFIDYGDPTQWADYRFVLTRPISNEQAQQVRRILESTAPARCNLVELIYTEAANLYNAAITYNGAFNHGAA